MGSHRSTKTRTGHRSRVVLAAAVPVGFLLSGALVWQASYAAFTASTTNPGNNWQAGTVVLRDDDGNAALFNATGLTPGSSGARCITVQYDGNVAADVRMYATVGATDLAPHLDLVIERSATPADVTCSGWSPAAALPDFSGTASELVADHSTYADGMTGWTPAGGAPGAKVTYRVQYTLDAAAPNDAQGDSAQLSFVWEAQNT